MLLFYSYFHETYHLVQKTNRQQTGIDVHDVTIIFLVVSDTHIRLKTVSTQLRWIFFLRCVIPVVLSNKMNSVHIIQHIR